MTQRRSSDLPDAEIMIGVEFFHLEGGHIEPMKPAWKLEEGYAFMQYQGESWRGCMEVVIPAHRVVMIESGVMIWTGAKWTRPWFERHVSAAPFDPVVNGDGEIIETTQPQGLKLSIPKDQVVARKPMFPVKDATPVVTGYPVAAPGNGIFSKEPGRDAAAG